MANIEILLISQCEDTKKKLLDTFANDNYSVDIVDNEDLGLELLRERDYSVVIEDINVGNNKSYCLLHKINVNQYSNISVFIIADSIIADDILMSYELGAIDIFDKNYEIEQLKDLVDNCHKNS